MLKTLVQFRRAMITAFMDQKSLKQLKTAIIKKKFMIRGSLYGQAFGRIAKRGAFH